MNFFYIRKKMTVVEKFKDFMIIQKSSPCHRVKHGNKHQERQAYLWTGILILTSCTHTRYTCCFSKILFCFGLLQIDARMRFRGKVDIWRYQDIFCVCMKETMYITNHWCYVRSAPVNIWASLNSVRLMWNGINLFISVIIQDLNKHVCVCVKTFS